MSVSRDSRSIRVHAVLGFFGCVLRNPNMSMKDDDALAAAIAFRCPAALRRDIEELASREGLLDVRKRQQELAADAA